MKQRSLGSSGFERKSKRTRKREFLDEMNRIVWWKELVVLIDPYVPKQGLKGDCPAFAVETMLRIHFLQQWFNVSDPGMEEALYDILMFREFACLDNGEETLSDESTILRFRHLLEKHDLSLRIFSMVNDKLALSGLLLKRGTVADATLIAAPCWTKNRTGERDPEVHQAKKGNQWHFGMKAHIGVDADSGLVHSVVGTAANAHDIAQVHALLHGEETEVFADAGYQGVSKRKETQGSPVRWYVARCPGKRRALDKRTTLGALLEELEKAKASIRAKVEHPFRVIKRQFGYEKVRYRGLVKNTGQIVTLFALDNLWMARKRLLHLQAQVCP